MGKGSGAVRKARREAQRVLLPERLAALQAIGADPKILDQNSSHVRIRFSGRDVDFWGSTERWRVAGQAGFEVGFDKLMTRLDELSQIPTPERGPSRLAGFALTIITDASFDFRTQASGWGAWMKGNDGPSIEIGGPFKVQSNNPTEAEFFAIVNALIGARAKGFMNTTGWAVLIQSDCQLALAMVRLVTGAQDRPVAGGTRVPVAKPRHIERVPEAVRHLKDLVLATGCVLTVRHVKGHTTRDDGRSWVNRRVDSIARQAMREQRGQRRRGNDSASKA